MANRGDDWFVTPQALATWMRLPNPDDNLTEVLGAAHEWAERNVGPISTCLRAFTVYRSGSGALVLPVTHIQEVAEVRDPNGVVVEPSGIDMLAGIIHLDHVPLGGGARGPGSWTVLARGRDHADAVALAIKIVASHLYTVHRGRAGGGIPGIKNVGEDVAAPKGFAIPKRADDLIAPYRRSPGFA